MYLINWQFENPNNCLRCRKYTFITRWGELKSSKKKSGSCHGLTHVRLLKLKLKTKCLCSCDSPTLPANTMFNQKQKLKTKITNHQTTNVSTVYSMKWHGSSTDLPVSAVSVVLCKTQYPQAVKQSVKHYGLTKLSQTCQPNKTYRHLLLLSGFGQDICECHEFI